eukprot:Opistho-2@23384
MSIDARSALSSSSRFSHSARTSNRRASASTRASSALEHFVRSRLTSASRSAHLSVNTSDSSTASRDLCSAAKRRPCSALTEGAIPEPTNARPSPSASSYMPTPITCACDSSSSCALADTAAHWASSHAILESASASTSSSSLTRSPRSLCAVFDAGTDSEDDDDATSSVTRTRRSAFPSSASRARSSATTSRPSNDVMRSTTSGSSAQLCAPVELTSRAIPASRAASAAARWSNLASLRSSSSSYSAICSRTPDVTASSNSSSVRACATEDSASSLSHTAMRAFAVFNSLSFDASAASTDATAAFKRSTSEASLSASPGRDPLRMDGVPGAPEPSPLPPLPPLPMLVPFGVVLPTANLIFASSDLSPSTHASRAVRSSSHSFFSSSHPVRSSSNARRSLSSSALDESMGTVPSATSRTTSDAAASRDARLDAASADSIEAISASISDMRRSRAAISASASSRASDCSIIVCSTSYTRDSSDATIADELRADARRTSFSLVRRLASSEISATLAPEEALSAAARVRMDSSFSCNWCFSRRADSISSTSSLCPMYSALI